MKRNPQNVYDVRYHCSKYERKMWRMSKDNKGRKRERGEKKGGGKGEVNDTLWQDSYSCNFGVFKDAFS